METTIRDLQNQFDQAELHADRNVLQRLIADDFLSIGPKGFVLNKQEWINRHDQFRYLALDISEQDIRLYDQAALVRNIQRNKATYNHQQVEVATRVMQVWVEKDGRWQIAGIQFSPLAEANS